MSYSLHRIRIFMVDLKQTFETLQKRFGTVLSCQGYQLLVELDAHFIENFSGILFNIIMEFLEF